MKLRITAMRIVRHEDLIARYENQLENPCPIKEGDTFLLTCLEKPEGLCESAWQTLFPFAFALMNGAESLYDGWMKNKKTAMVSCNDGFRPVSFYLEVID